MNVRIGRELLAPLLLGVVLIVGWWLTTTLSSVPSFVLPTPGAVLDRLIGDLTTAETWHYLGQTLAEAFGGCVLGLAVAIPLAVVIHESRAVSDAVNPFLGATQAIPAIALAPLLVLWVGYGLKAVMLLCALMVFFPILIATVVGLGHVDKDVVDAARVDGASRWDTLVHVEGPMALPSILSGLRNGFTLSITGAVVGEMVMGGDGLGQVLTVQRDAVDTAGMFATIIVLCLVASLVYSLIRYWERHSAIIDSLLKTSSTS